MYGSRGISRSSCTVRSNSAPEEAVCWVVGNYLGSEDILLEKALLDQFLQVPSERLAIDGLVPFAVVVEAVLL